MSEGSVHLRVADRVASVVLDRPESLNAMTFRMYDQLAAICAEISGNPEIRVVTFRGQGKAFTAGTDIREFLNFRTAQDGIDYERRVNDVIAAIEDLSAPTIAVIDGPAMGGGLAIAAACDFRIATPGARFGAPIARTIGNCLSLPNVQRLVFELGLPRVKRLLLLAETFSAEEASTWGFLLHLSQPEELDRNVDNACRTLISCAPITLRASKQMLRRLLHSLPLGEDFIRSSYGSNDFKAGVRAFLEKRCPEWTGQ